MNVTKLVKLVDSDEHFGNIKPCMLFLENARVVEESTKIASGNILHC
jgi:hypothetical protein